MNNPYICLLNSERWGHALKTEIQNSPLKWEYLERTIFLLKKRTYYTTFLTLGGTVYLTILRPVTFFPQANYFPFSHISTINNFS